VDAPTSADLSGSGSDVAVQGSGIKASDTRVAGLNVLWLQSGGCGGCSLSLLNADTADFHGQLRDAGVNLLWHPSLSLESGAESIEILDACLDGRMRLDALCIEGAVLRGPNGTGRFHMLAGTGRPMMDWIQRLSTVAHHVLAMGSCAAWGGITAGGSNPTDACGLQYDNDHRGGLLGADFVAKGGLPVINVAGCPTHPGWVLDTLMLLAGGELRADSLDALARPRFYSDQLVHHGCTRNEYYEFKASAEAPAQLGCLMEHLGCKGTQAHADCNTRLWNGEGSCTRGGYACISCTEPGFQEPGHAFHLTPKVAGIPIGLPTDMPKAWFVALASLSKSATPRRVKQNAVADHLVVPPTVKRTRLR
jgi:ferredoxin hydrogenase small subunit